MAVSLQGLKDAGSKACNWTAETRVVQGTKKLGCKAVEWLTPTVDPHNTGFSSLDRSVTRVVVEKIQDQQEEGGFINFFLTRGEASLGIMGCSLYDAGTHGIQGVYQIPLAVLKGATRTVGITNDGRSFSQDVVEGARHVSRALRNTVLAVGSVLGLLAPGCVQVVDDLVGATDIWDTYKAQTVKKAAGTYLGKAGTKLSTLKNATVQTCKDHPRATKVAVGTLSALGLALGVWCYRSGPNPGADIGPNPGADIGLNPDGINPEDIKNVSLPVLEQIGNALGCDPQPAADWVIDNPKTSAAGGVVGLGAIVYGTQYGVKKVWNKIFG